MKIIDLSQKISEDMSVYPGTAQPELSSANTINDDGFRETMLRMTSHTGTHIDAPAHILSDAPSLDKLSLEHFYGKALIIDVSNYKGQKIPCSLFLSRQTELDCVAFVILKSDYHRYWGSSCYFKDYPLLSLEAAEFLAALPLLKGVGIDMISIDAIDSEDFPNHKIFFRAGKIIIENLTNLDAIKSNWADICVMPLKIAGADGSPVRAIALIKD